MANVTITGLPPVVSLDLTAVFPIVQGNVTQKTTLSAIQGVVTSNVANLSANNISVASAISASAISAPIIMGGNISGNIANTTGGYSNVNVAAYLGNVAVDIIPTANNVQNLGSPTKQFKDLYLSNATLYFNSIPMSVTTANTLQFNGANVVVAANGNSVTQGNIAVSGNIVANNVIGNIAVANVVGLGNIATVNKNGNTSTFLNGNGAWAAVGNYGNSDVAAYLPTNDSDVQGQNIHAMGNITAGSVGGPFSIVSVVSSTPTTVTLQGMPMLPFPIIPGDLVDIVGAAGGQAGIDGLWPVISVSGTDFVISNSSQPATGFTGGATCLIYRGGEISAVGNVTGAYLLGDISHATGLGNVSVINLNGNVSEVLAGDGTWTSIPSSSGIVNGTSSVSIPTANANIVSTVNGNIVWDLNADGNTVIPGNILGVPGGYNQPNFIQPNSADSNWTFGIVTDGVADFWMQTQFYGLSQPTRGFRVYEAEGGTVPFSVDGTGNVNVSNTVVINSTGITQTPNQDFTITVQDPSNDDSYGVTSLVVDGTGTAYSGTKLQSGSFNVTTGSGAYNWQFSGAGILNTPGNIQGVDGGSTSFYAIDDGSAGSVELKTISYAGATLGSNVTVRQSNVTISTNNSGSTWTYDNTGDLTFPDATVQSTAWTGAVPVANVTGLGNIATANLNGNVSEVLAGDGTWVAQSTGSSYGDSNVSAYLSSGADTAGYYTNGDITGAQLTIGLVYSPNFYSNAIVYANTDGFLTNINTFTYDPASGTVNADYFAGNGSTLSSLTGSNVVGYVSDATHATIANTSNVALSVNVANVANIGNIAIVNLNGNTSTYLNGNGVWTTVSGGSSYGDSNVSTYLASGNNSAGFSTTGNVTANNFVTSGSSGNITGANVISAVTLSASGNISAAGNITATGTGTNMVRRSSTIGAANTKVTLDSITAQVGGSPVRLFIGTASGTMTVAGTSQTMTSGSIAVSSWINVPLQSTAGNEFAMSGALTTEGDTAVLNITDQISGTGTWRVTGLIANISSNLYSVSIERLV